jgi:hypothetical protein
MIDSDGRPRDLDRFAMEQRDKEGRSIAAWLRSIGLLHPKVKWEEGHRKGLIFKPPQVENKLQEY